MCRITYRTNLTYAQISYFLLSNKLYPTISLCNVRDTDILRKIHLVHLGQSLEIHKGEVLPGLVSSEGRREEVQPVQHVEVVVAVVVVLAVAAPGHHLGAHLAGEELVHQPHQALGRVVVIHELLSLAWFLGRSPVPQLGAEAVQEEVDGEADVLLDIDVLDESLVRAEQEQDVHENCLMRPIVFPPEILVDGVCLSSLYYNALVGT